MKFDEILTNDDLLDALWDMHFDDCTPIQEQAMPKIQDGHDLIAVAQTGTGKTAAYLLPVIEKLASGKYPQDAVNCIVMAPTRELAQQIDRQMQGFAYFMGLSSVPVYGGTDGHTFNQQKRGLTMGADVVIATPGRLLAHLSMGYVDLSRTSFFILDEADRMLDMGFFDDIMQIASYLPKERQTLLFSATMPPKIQMLASKILNKPEEVKLAVSKPADKIIQTAYSVYETQKLPLLRNIFKQTPPKKVIVFASSKLKVKELFKTLRSDHIAVGEMHSDLEQEKRDNVMLDFKSGRINVLVATDIVARGIDIDDIEMVVNYDVPGEPEDYVHRIGRTARADADGKGITFISEKEKGRFRRIEQLLEQEVPKGIVPAELGDTPVYSATDRSARNRRKKASSKPRTRKPDPRKTDVDPSSSEKESEKRSFKKLKSPKKSAAGDAKEDNTKADNTTPSSDDAAKKAVNKSGRRRGNARRRRRNPDKAAQHNDIVGPQTTDNAVSNHKESQTS